MGMWKWLKRLFTKQHRTLLPPSPSEDQGTKRYVDGQIDKYRDDFYYQNEKNELWTVAANGEKFMVAVPVKLEFPKMSLGEAFRRINLACGDGQDMPDACPELVALRGAGFTVERRGPNLGETVITIRSPDAQQQREKASKEKLKKCQDAIKKAEEEFQEMRRTALEKAFYHK